jgi:hypothetical protein
MYSYRVKKNASSDYEVAIGPIQYLMKTLDWGEGGNISKFGITGVIDPWNFIYQYEYFPIVERREGLWYFQKESFKRLLLEARIDVTGKADILRTIGAGLIKPPLDAELADVINAMARDIGKKEPYLHESLTLSR